MSREKAFNFFRVLTKVGLGGVLFFIPISNALISSFIGLALCGFIGKKIIKPDFRWLKNKENIFLVAFCVFMALSLFNSGQHIPKSLIALFLKWGKYIGLSLIIQDAIEERRDVLIFVSIFFFSASLVALSGVTQFFWGVEFLRGKGMVLAKGFSVEQGVQAITSSFNQANGLGAYLVIPCVLSVALLRSLSRVKLKTWYLGPILLLLIVIFTFCIFYTYSRGAWLGVLIGLTVMFFISGGALIIAIVSAITGLFLFIPTFQSILFSIFKLGGDANRFLYWQGAIGMFKEHPFLGRGIGTFMDYFVQYKPCLGVVYAHNCFLQILAESGIFSLIAFLSFIVLVLYAGMKKFTFSKDPVLLGGICGTTGFLVHSFFEVNLYSLPLAVLFWLWVGIIRSLGSHKSKERF